MMQLKNQIMINMLQKCKNDQDILSTYYLRKILDLFDTVNFVSRWSLTIANNGYKNKLVRIS